jgi:hypothetical protein
VFFAIVDVWSMKFTCKYKTNPIQTLPFRRLFVLNGPILYECPIARQHYVAYMNKQIKFYPNESSLDPNPLDCHEKRSLI